MDSHARLALIGRLLRAVSHELNNPLTTIAGFGQLIAARAEDVKLRADAAEIVEASASASRYVGALAALAKGSGSSTADLGEVVDEALTLIGYELRAAGIGVDRRQPGGPAPVSAPAGQLLEAVLHLVVDALDGFETSPGGATAARRVEISTSVDGRTALLTIAADGRRAGTRWLGLDRCAEILRMLGGSLEESPQAARPRTTRIRLPLAAGLETVPDEGPAPAPAAGRPVRVLVADDDPGLRLLLSEALAGQGLAIEAVATAEQAVSRALATRPDRLLVDVRMPGGGGEAVWRGLAAADPQLAERVVFVTADAGNERVSAFLAATGRRVIRKPFQIPDLRAALDLDAPPPRA